jgi:hypothetical protein
VSINIELNLANYNCYDILKLVQMQSYNIYIHTQYGIINIKLLMILLLLTLDFTEGKILIGTIHNSFFVSVFYLFYFLFSLQSIYNTVEK